MNRIARCLVCLLLVVSWPEGAASQLIRGTVILSPSGRGVDGAEITLRDGADSTVARVLSDSTGAFSLSVPGPGRYALAASRIGLASVVAYVQVGDREVVEVELSTTESAIPLDPLYVVARRRIARGTLDEFYDRMARMKQRGLGQFLTREELARLERSDVSLALERVPGLMSSPTGGSAREIRMVGVRGTCIPDIYLDGLPLVGTRGGAGGSVRDPDSGGLYPFGDGGGGAGAPRYATLQVMDLEGVEVYRGAFERPGFYPASECGVVLLWRKKDWGDPFSFKTLALVGGLAVGFLVFLGSLF